VPEGRRVCRRRRRSRLMICRSAPMVHGVRVGRDVRVRVRACMNWTRVPAPQECELHEEQAR
jgi:hypothetical protein